MLPALLALALSSAAGVVWSSAVKLPPGGRQVLKATGVRAGAWYALETSGTCTRPERRRSRAWRESVSGGRPPQVMGVDFKVSIDGVERISVDHQPRATRFKATRDDPELQVEDQSTPQAGVRCALTRLVIRRPDGS